MVPRTLENNVSPFLTLECSGCCYLVTFTPPKMGGGGGVFKIFEWVYKFLPNGKFNLYFADWQIQFEFTSRCVIAAADPYMRSYPCRSFYHHIYSYL